jgi:hypothetical protein
VELLDLWASAGAGGGGRGGGLGRLDGSALLVAAAPLAARDGTWALQPVDPATLVDQMLAAPIRRADWSAAWRPEAKPTRVVADPAVGVVHVGPRRLEAVIARSGVVQAGRATIPPAAAVERLHVAAHGRRRPRR